MRLFVTGGTGFVGRHVVDALLTTEDSTVSVLTRENHSDGPRLTYVKGDIGDAGLLRRAMQGHDCVVHLAGCKHRQELFHHTNIKGTQNLIDACRLSTQFRQLIYLSGVDVYGVQKSSWVDEQTECTPDTPFGRSRHEAELIVRKFAEEKPGRVVILRPGNIFGERDPEHHLLNLLKKVRSNRFYFVGRDEQCYHVNYIDVKEVGELIKQLIGSRLARCVYIVNTPARLTEFVSILKKITNQTAVVRHLPYWPAKIAAQVFDSFPKSILRRPPINSLKLRELTNKTVYSPARLTNELNWRPRCPLPVALTNLHRHYLELGLL